MKNDLTVKPSTSPRMGKEGMAHKRCSGLRLSRRRRNRALEGMVNYYCHGLPFEFPWANKRVELRARRLVMELLVMTIVYIELVDQRLH